MGGLMQLVAYGAQDIYLTGNPQITFFKVVYRRHTNFAMECIEQIFGSSIGASASTVTSNISRKGDLISGMHLDIKMSSQTPVEPTGSGDYLNWINNTGHGFIDEVQIDIGGHVIDKHHGQWLDIYNELTDHDNREAMLLNRQADKPTSNDNGVNTALQLYVPLKFWFCRNQGLALPLIALQYHDVELKLKTRGMPGLIASNQTLNGFDNTAPNVSLWVDYIFLDTDERRRFAQSSHEYLIEQVQRQSNLASTSQPLYFNHPVKELIWVHQDQTAATQNTSTTAADINPNANTITSAAEGDYGQKNDYFNYQANRNGDTEYVGGGKSFESFATCKLELNGHDRFAARKASYFRLVQPLQAGHNIPTKHIYVYSFALKPEEHQPSGSCNFSRIENAKLTFTTGQTYSNTDCIVYAINYNVFRVMSGMGGLAYSS
jgi:hypothetical protein